MISYEDLIAFNYDSKSGPKITAALNKLKLSEESRSIMNTEFQILKSTFNRAHSSCLSEVFSTLKKKHHIVDLYTLPSSIQELIYINRERPGSAIKKIYANNELAENPFVKDYVEYLELVDKIVKRIDALKPFIVKGRKPNVNSVPKFAPKMTSCGVIEILQSNFKEICLPFAVEIKAFYVSGFKKEVEVFKKNKSDGQVKTKINHSFLLDIRGNLLKDELLEKAIENYASEYTKDVINSFISKNISKIGSIIDRKGTLKSMTVLDAKVGYGKLNSSVSFKLDNGPCFTVLSKIVIVYSQKVFSRYPTTFHDITDSNGVFHKSESEEWMNTEF